MHGFRQRAAASWGAEIALREPDWIAAQQITDELAADAGVTEADMAWARSVLGLDETMSDAA